MKQKTAIVTIGIPASGKTTWAQEHAKKTGAVIISRDVILFEILGHGSWKTYRPKPAIEAMVTDTANWMIDTAAANGCDVIIADTNLIESYRNELCAKLANHGYAITFKSFPITLEEALARDAARSNPVGASVIARMYDSWCETPWAVSAFHRVEPHPHVHDLNDAVIVDVDGTLMHMGGRKPFDWSRVGEDTPDREVVDVINGLHMQGYRIIVMSGRDEVCREQTIDSLNGCGLKFHDLHMRREKDYRPDTEVKSDLYMAHVHGKYKVKLVVDDRPIVVRMWRTKFGLKTMALGNQMVEF